MIPKKIHYFWNSDGDMPEEVISCINNWKKMLPDFEIIKWDLTNFDVNCCRYVSQACNNKKWAFVSDYVRLYVLYQYGGVYFDTDVEVIGSMDKFMELKAFCGFERLGVISTAVMGAEPGNKTIKELLELYSNIDFLFEDDKFDLTPNTKRLSDYLKTIGMNEIDEKQEVGEIIIFPRTVFCPFNPYAKGNKMTKASVTIHHFDGAWLAKEEKERMDMKKKYMYKYGSKLGTIIFAIKSNIGEGGVKLFINKLLKKLRGK